MTKKEKLLTLEALKKDAQESKEKHDEEGNTSLSQYDKGRVDALNDAIAILKNGSVGNAIKEVYIGKENE